MKTFPGWREVGRAMRWARQQDGVTVERVRDDETGRISWLWLGHAGLITADYFPASDPAEATIETARAYIDRARFEDGATVLRVLAALDLIPAELAEVAAAPNSPTETVRADRLVAGDTFIVPMTESIETVTTVELGSYVLVTTDGTGPNHPYAWAHPEPIDVVSRGGAA